MYIRVSAKFAAKVGRSVFHGTGGKKELQNGERKKKGSEEEKAPHVGRCGRKSQKLGEKNEPENARANSIHVHVTPAARSIHTALVTFNFQWME